MKYHFTTNDLKRNTWAKFEHVMSRFNEVFNEIVIQDGGPDAILNNSVIWEIKFMKI